jgi:hypothetical protein
MSHWQCYGGNVLDMWTAANDKSSDQRAVLCSIYVTVVYRDSAQGADSPKPNICIELRHALE